MEILHAVRATGTDAWHNSLIVLITVGCCGNWELFENIWQVLVTPLSEKDISLSTKTKHKEVVCLTLLCKVAVVA